MQRDHGHRRGLHGLLCEDPDTPWRTFWYWAQANIAAARMGAHYYRFELAPLDTARVSIPTDGDAKQLWKRMEPHIVAEAPCD